MEVGAAATAMKVRTRMERERAEQSMKIGGAEEDDEIEDQD